MKLIVTEDQNKFLLSLFTSKDVGDGLFDMHLDKSLGIDGMNLAFYQKFWHIVGENVSSSILQMIRECSLPNDLNETQIILIPKKK